MNCWLITGYLPYTPNELLGQDLTSAGHYVTPFNMQPHNP